MCNLSLNILEDGIELGTQLGIQLGIQALILDYEEEGISPERIIEKLQKRFSLTKEQAKDYIKRFSAAR